MFGSGPQNPATLKSLVPHPYQLCNRVLPTTTPPASLSRVVFLDISPQKKLRPSCWKVGLKIKTNLAMYWVVTIPQLIINQQRYLAATAQLNWLPLLLFIGSLASSSIWKSTPVALIGTRRPTVTEFSVGKPNNEANFDDGKWVIGGYWLHNVLYTDHD